jgi:hypothetical protein
MSDETLPSNFPTRQKIEAEGRSGRNRVTGKLKVALDLMVWQGQCRAVAAEHAGLADSSLRAALRKPHVLNHYNSELSALRTSLRAKNVHRLDALGDQPDNKMAAVQAIKALETIADQADAAHRPGMQQLPGLQIVILCGAAAPRIIGPSMPQQIEGEVVPNRPASTP